MAPWKIENYYNIQDQEPIDYMRETLKILIRIRSGVGYTRTYDGSPLKTSPRLPKK